MKPLKLALLSLTRRFFASTLAVGSLAIAVAVGTVLFKLYLITDSRFSTLGRAGDSIVGAKAGNLDILLGATNFEGDPPGFLPYKLYESLQSQAQVKFEDGTSSQPKYIKSVIPYLYFGTIKNFRVIGTDQSFLNRPNPQDSLTFSSGSWVDQPSQVVLGSEVAKKLSLSVGSQIWGDCIYDNSKRFQVFVSGILNPTNSTWDRGIYSNIGTAQGVLTTIDLKDKSIWGPNVLNYFLIYLEPGGFQPLQNLVNNRTVGQLIAVSDEINHLKKITSGGKEIGFMMSALIIILSSLGVLAMLLTRFEGMTVQVSVMRAIGYSKSEIGLWLIYEGLIIGIAAVLIGQILEWIIFWVVGQILEKSLPSLEILNVHFYQMYPIWAATLIGSIFAVFIPLIRLYRTDVHTALKV